MISAAIIIILLSLFDALMTLHHIALGIAIEANPLMGHVLTSMGSVAFLVVKMAMTPI